MSESAPPIYRYRVRKDDDGTYRVGIAFMGVENVAADGIVDAGMAHGLADRLRDGQVVIADLTIIRVTEPRSLIDGI